MHFHPSSPGKCHPKGRRPGRSTQTNKRTTKLNQTKRRVRTRGTTKLPSRLGNYKRNCKKTKKQNQKKSANNRNNKHPKKTDNGERIKKSKTGLKPRSLTSSSSFQHPRPPRGEFNVRASLVQLQQKEMLNTNDFTPLSEQGSLMSPREETTSVHSWTKGPSSL